jgi:hypothetical protein
MKRISLVSALFIITLLSGCQIIGDIFKAGAYTGIIAVIIVIALVIWLFSKFTNRN